MFLLTACISDNYNRAHDSTSPNSYAAPGSPPEKSPGESFYKFDYDRCLSNAYQRSTYVAQNVQQQVIALYLNACMHDLGWEQFAPANEEMKRQYQQVLPTATVR